MNHFFTDPMNLIAPVIVLALWIIVLYLRRCSECGGWFEKKSGRIEPLPDERFYDAIIYTTIKCSHCGCVKRGWSYNRLRKGAPREPQTRPL